LLVKESVDAGDHATADGLIEQVPNSKRPDCSEGGSLALYDPLKGIIVIAELIRIARGALAPPTPLGWKLSSDE